MTKQEILIGLKQGRTLIQEEWADPSEIASVDELVAEGLAQATLWKWGDALQCDFRTVTAVEVK